MLMEHSIVIMTFGLLTNFYGQTYQKSETILKKDFAERSRNGGRWVFYSDKADIKKIDKSFVKSVIPEYDFYQVTMTNYLGYHRYTEINHRTNDKEVIE